MSVSGFPSFHHLSVHRSIAGHRWRWRLRLLAWLVAGLLALIAALVLEIRVLTAVGQYIEETLPVAGEVKRAVVCAAALMSPGPDPGCRVEPLLPR